MFVWGYYLNMIMRIYIINLNLKLFFKILNRLKVCGVCFFVRVGELVGRLLYRSKGKIDLVKDIRKGWW